MCRTTQRTQPVRLPTACRVFLKNAVRPVYIAEPSYEDVARAHEHWVANRHNPSQVDQIMEVMTTGAAQMRLDLALVTGILSEPLAEKLDARQAEIEAAQAAEQQFAEPTLDLPRRRVIIDFEGDLATVLVEEVGITAPVELFEQLDLVGVGRGALAALFSNPAFEGNYDAYAKAVRAIAIEEQRHEDAMNAAHPTGVPAPETAAE